MSEETTGVGAQPSEEELRAAFEEQLRNIRVEDVVLQTVATLINLAGRRLGLAGDPAERDLEQAKLAIEAARALVPLCPAEQAEPVKQAMAQVQMAFAREAQESGVGAPQTSDPRPQTSGAQDPSTAQSEEDVERAKARAKIWTPGSG
jgi:hypothetical protein